MRILFFGDSNTWGYDPSSGRRFENRFTRLVQNAFPQDEILEEGLNGRTLCHIDPYDTDRIGLYSIQMLCKSHLPIDLLVIMLGTNDAKRIFNTNMTSLSKGYSSLLYKILDESIYKAGYTKPKILLVSPPRLNEKYREIENTWINFGDEGFMMLEQAYDHMVKMLEPFDVHILDSKVRAGSFDAIHLDEEGHQELAQRIIQKIKEITL